MSTKNMKLACFSPPVMIATFLLEMFLAVYTLWRHRSIRMGWLVAAALVSLATFQLAEWMVCEGALGLSSYEWAQIGYVAITLLPPIGIHIGMEVYGRYQRTTLVLAYLSALSFLTYFLLATSGVDSSMCLGNYVIFEMAPTAAYSFATYYYVWLLVGMGGAFWFASKAKNSHTASSLRGLGVGYASFVAPVIVAYLIDSTTIRGIPSIMCGFAVIFAIILTQWVVPQYLLSNKANKA